MANESKTELITIEHFRQFKDQIVFEWKSSDNPTINKLLKNASKKWSWKWFPDFMISLNANSDLLIVIECKADIRKHESENKDKYADYAVDWVLLYSDSLSKEFDILSIAISWDNERNLRVSHFLQLKNEKKVTQVFWDKLLSIDDYLNWYLKSPEKFRQDYNKLQQFTKLLNDTLHSYKVLESQRSLLISCILIALEYRPFREWYKHYDNSRDLANYLVDTVVNSLKTANIQWDKLENLWIQFSFIRTDTSLSTKQNILKNLIKDIDENINQFIKTHEYFDVLWQLYVEFLRYANSDKWLWIVLTPPHITELFSELAQVNKNSIVYDNCTWTWWFLISAMKKMIEDAKWEDEIIKNIKSKQLIWVEYQSHIFALAVSNMYIHQDWKTNIINWSCFDKEIIERVKLLKPTAWFLNPPYKADKKNDIEEFEFILNNLECLTDWWISISIIPMSCALATKWKMYELKKKLLEKHTLEAVLSMPDDLFIDSDVWTVTCVMVFKAHKPHPKNKKTFFGYFKNDWYEKRRKWRIDMEWKWPLIKETWINAFINRDNVDNLSINIEVSAIKEWCPEAYLKTDFSQIQNNNFIGNLKEYCIYLFNNWLSKEISINSINNENINLNNKKCDYFEVKKFFDIYSWWDKPKPDDAKHWWWELINSVENQTTNNWIKEKIEFSEQDKIFENFISVVSIWEWWKAFFQPERSACFTRVKGLVPKSEYFEKFNKYIFLYFCTLLDLERYRYGYWRVLSKDRLWETILYIPIDDNWEPDWNFMENYIKSLSYSSSL